MGYGDITLPNGVHIDNVLDVLMLKVSLLSITVMLQLGLNVQFKSSGRTIVFLDGQRVVMNGSQHGSLLQLNAAQHPINERNCALIVQQK